MMQPGLTTVLKGIAFTLMLTVNTVVADEILVAVASNFTNAFKSIAQRFETQTGHKVKLTSGSTGKHYAQIINGAPFDAFFAADSKRPQLLEENGTAFPDSRFTYAIGKVVLWSPHDGFVDPDGDMLAKREFRHLSIANPKLAPYGKAAQEIMQHRKVWRSLRATTVRGENIGQAFQFVKSGNAELGFVAFSQIKHPNRPISGSYWEVPQSLYTPINQQAVLLKDSEAARAFLEFTKSGDSLEIIRGFGYGTP